MTADEPQAKRMKLHNDEEFANNQSNNHSLPQSISQRFAEDFHFDISMLQSLNQPIDMSTLYENQSILAPMVRINTLPFRLISRLSGCKLVYSEELIAHKLVTCTRSVRPINPSKQSDAETVSQSINHSTDQSTNPITHLVDFIPASKSNQSNNQPVNQSTFTTYANEPVILQLGANDSQIALKAAQIFIDDVVGVDLNLGCPEKFSVSGGMGSALLTQPDIVADILTTLRQNLPSNKTVTCKIRMLEDDRLTVELMRRAEKCGVNAIGVHARYVHDRPMKVKAMTEHVKPLVECVKVPVIYNGDCFTPEDVVTMKQLTGCSSVMIARGAMWNPTVFADSMLPVFDVARQYRRVAAMFPHNLTNTKYCLQEMIKPHIPNGAAFGAIGRSKTDVALAEALQQLKLEVEEGINNAGVTALKKESYRRFMCGPYRPPTISWQPRPARTATVQSEVVTTTSEVAITAVG